MPGHFTADEWRLINTKLDATPERFGFPTRREGSVLLGSFNIRKLGNPDNRTEDEWAFLARVCAQFDLLGMQEIMSDLAGLRRLRKELEAHVDTRSEGFALVVSDETGAFVGDRGLRERLGFLYRWPVVERGEIASDLTYDRTKTFKALVDNRTALIEALESCGGDVREFNPSFFVTFARQPHGVAFRIGQGKQRPYEIMAVNAHLIFAGRVDERRREFTALMDLLKSRLGDDDNINLILTGDLNLDFDNPDTDRDRIDEQIKDLNDTLTGNGSHINFPFLDAHKDQDDVFRTNARRSETYDHIGLFAHDTRLPSYDENELMPRTAVGPDYGVFDFMELFADAIYDKTWKRPDEGRTRPAFGQDRAFCE